MKKMNIKYIFFFIAITVLLSALTVMPVISAAPNGGILVNSGKISGYKNYPITSQEITVEIEECGFYGIAKGADLKALWNINAPIGLNLTVKNRVERGDTSITITVSGTPTQVKSGDISIEIPKESLAVFTTETTDEDKIITKIESVNENLTITNSNVKWEIKETHKVSFGVLNSTSSVGATNTTEGSITAEFIMDGVKKTPASSPIHVPEDTIVTFTATPKTTSSQNYIIGDWRKGSENALTHDYIVTAAKDEPIYTTEAITGDCTIAVAFKAGPTAYVIDISKVTQEIKTDLKEMKFGVPTGVTIPGEDIVVVTNQKDDDGENIGKNIFPDGYQYNVKVSSANAEIALGTFVEDGDTDNSPKLELKDIAVGSLTGYSLNITPQGRGTTKITVTVTHSDDEDTLTLKEAKVEFDVEVKAAETTLTKESDYEVKAKTTLADGNDGELQLDFKNETAKTTGNITIKGYSLNGGSSWTAISINSEKDTDISKILDGGSKVMFAQEVASDKKSAKPSSAVWEIGEITKRESAPKLTVVYGQKGSEDFSDDNKWYFKEEIDNLLYVSSKDGKNFDKTAAKAEDWREYSEEIKTAGDEQNYSNLRGLNAQKKVQKSVYFAKTAPVVEIKDPTDNSKNTLTPASKTKKVKVSGMLVPPKFKVDYKKEIVSAKAGTLYKLDGSANFNEMTKEGVTFSDIFRSDTTAEKIVKAYTPSTGKKPRSAEAEIKVQGYIAFSGNPASGFDKDKHKFKLPKGFEMWDDAKGKWVTSIKIKETTTVNVRLKGNAKYDAKNTVSNLKSGTKTASATSQIEFEWGEYPAKPDSDKMKEGIVNVTMK